MATRDEDVSHERGLAAIKRVDLEKVKNKMNYIPKCFEAYQNQYPYDSTDEYGSPLELTSDIIENLVFKQTYGLDPQINRNQVKKCVLLGDALYLDDFIGKFFVKCRESTFLNIFPHSYTVISNDPIVRQARLGFVEVINLSRGKLTMSELKQDENLFKELFNIQPDIISFNVGLSDIMLENFAWRENQVPGKFIENFKELIIYYHTYFHAAGYRGAFCDNLVYTFNMLPVYDPMDKVAHNKENMQAVQVHKDLWGSSYHDISRDTYKRTADSINRRLHTAKNIMFEKYKCVLFQPTPRWKFSGLHVDSKTGLPDNNTHDLMLKNFLFCLSRACCTKKICTLGIYSTKFMATDKILHEGCAKTYLREID